MFRHLFGSGHWPGAPIGSGMEARRAMSKFGNSNFDKLKPLKVSAPFSTVRDLRHRQRISRWRKSF